MDLKTIYKKDFLERLTGKRKLSAKADVPVKRSKFPSYFISELAHVVAFVDDRIPFDNLALGGSFDFYVF